MLHNPLEMGANTWFWAALGAWSVAQIIKMICAFMKTRKLDIAYMVSTGGMPSAHSAMVSGLSFSIGLTEGFHSPIFALSVGLATVTMFDAATLRYAAGQQAKLLNEMVNELFKEHHFNETKLKELLGHTRVEVFMGMLTGIVTATNIVLWLTK